MLREIGRNKGVLHVTKTDWQAKKFHIGVKKSCYVPTPNFEYGRGI